MFFKHFSGICKLPSRDLPGQLIIETLEQGVKYIQS